MSDCIYWDYFAEEYCTKKDQIAPPERYLEVCPNVGDSYIEGWSTRDGRRLNVAYSKLDIESHHVGMIRRFMEEKNECKLSHLQRLYIPRDSFEEIVEECTEEQEDEE